MPLNHRETSVVILSMAKVPGPGAYENEPKYDSKGLKFAAQTSREIYYRTRSCEDLGPGRYNVQIGSFGEGPKVIHNKLMSS